MENSISTKNWANNWTTTDFRAGLPLTLTDDNLYCPFYEAGMHLFKFGAIASPSLPEKFLLHLVGSAIGYFSTASCKSIESYYDKTDISFDIGRFVLSILPFSNTIKLMNGGTVAFFQQAKRDFQYKTSYLNENLFNATLEGNMKQVEDLCSKGAEINAEVRSVSTVHGFISDRFRYTPLGVVSVKGSRDQIKTLVSLGADVKREFGHSHERMAPIESAIFNGNEEAFLELLKLHPNLESFRADVRGSYPIEWQNLGELAFSSWVPKSAIYSTFLSDSSPIEKKHSTKLLHCALGYKPGLTAEEALVPVKDILAFSNEHVNVRNREGFTPLLYLVSCSSILSDYKETFVGKKTGTPAMKMLHASEVEENLLLTQWAKFRYSSFVDSAIGLLLNAGADLNAKDLKGNTALHWACLNGLGSEIEERLINAGANPDLPNNAGWTPNQIKEARSQEGYDEERLYRHYLNLIDDTLYLSETASISARSLKTNLAHYFLLSEHPDYK